MTGGQPLEVLLVANYAPDRWLSMRKFADLLERELSAAGLRVRVSRPPGLFGRLWPRPSGPGKWLGYIDKFLVYPALLRLAAARADVVHICDHANAMYTLFLPARCARVVTCHDLLAVRGGLGEQTDCPASRFGRLLQRWILLGLRHAHAVPCVSSFTREDARRLEVARDGRPALPVVLNAQNYPFRRLEVAEVDRRLQPWAAALAGRPFVLHVGSAQLRKNREGVLRTFAIHARGDADALLVFAGQPLPSAHRALAVELGIAERVLEIVRPPDEVVEALYNRAFALLFPSRHEGFGWPVIEAQSCGCPVVCSDIPPTREVAGDTALMRVPEDAEGMADCLRTLADPLQRRRVVDAGYGNTARFSASAMAAQYIAVYRSLLNAVEPAGLPA